MASRRPSLSFETESRVTDYRTCCRAAATSYTAPSEIDRWDDAFVAVEDLDRARRKLVDAADGRYVEPGYLAGSWTMMVAPFDRERLQLTGAPIAAEFEVVLIAGNTNADSGAGQFAASATGDGVSPRWIVPEMPWPRSGGSTATDASSPLALRHARLRTPGCHPMAAT